ncbi:peptide chain release factor N(5)-glutamine methyltransferase [Tenacibaculum sp. M341]|uniref:peptide chain release factor N(5)-glutamine methyltransferase n=1 Tax=Tenacibaculum sp. M341 TaxID=2530339 RepID=UPI00104BEF24|nr:peptide chain release factor N(5)-glutamine methyltransferase [Tenacibaculum sp. M341]TCI91048.1 peptide chain release factor N(5)-glutamine methyltransferase [Tenacibaculum sp. M341]
MNIKDFRIHFNSKLSDLYPKTEIDAFFFRVVEHELGLSLMDVFTKNELEISEEKLQNLHLILSKLQQEEPIQYILGETSFYGFTFKVNSNVLIPRPETEELVEWIINSVNNSNNKVSILDIGTGSGCIAISLEKSIPSSNVYAIDISEKAIEMAKNNAILNNAFVTFIQNDILNEYKLEKSFDVIVSNPPYVRELEKKEIKNNVLNNEPHLALFVEDNNPLIFYSRIADVAKDQLNENGLLFFEINQYLGKETKEMLLEKGFKNIELKKDLFGNDRMIKATL